MLKNKKLMLAVVFIGLITMLVTCESGFYAPKENTFSTVEYNGHTYIVYDGGDYDSGICHDPDCKCGWLKKSN